MPEEINLPWKPRTRQMEGMASEKRYAKSKGARLHPRSGAGSIKADASTDTELIEHKDANLVYQLKSVELETLFKYAVRQGKEPVFVIRFANGIVATITITKEMQ